MKFEIEDKGQPEPHEDIQCFIEINEQWIKGASVEIKEKFSRLLGNKRAGGLLFSYGVRDCPSGTYYSCLTTLQHWFFFKTSNNQNEIVSCAIAPPFGSSESKLFTWKNTSDSGLQAHLPVKMPDLFVDIVHFIDHICFENELPVKAPVFNFTPIGQGEAQQLNVDISKVNLIFFINDNSEVTILHQSNRSLILGLPKCNLIDRAVLKISNPDLLKRETDAHIHLDAIDGVT